ncbi:hypothetical protein [Halobaculum roseum]|uniref:IS1 family transposase n=1 Tax=Halobaculum roseum TaxID=2175149 RepID=A0ABD5MML4_9EURY|nr:hypothetical protein [Halobaculum roseum]QZY03580.1 hypothetical protein K6T36_05285 [Halobaculum roseum]
MFAAPSCPNCGSEFLVTRVRTHGYPRRTDGSVKRFYRCFRCFFKFSGDDVVDRE